MKSLLFVGPWPPPFGGIASHLYELLPGLSNIGYDVHILSYCEKRIEKKSIEKGVNIKHFNPSKFFKGNLFQILKKSVLMLNHKKDLNYKRYLRALSISTKIDKIVKENNIDFIFTYAADQIHLLPFISNDNKRIKIFTSIYGAFFLNPKFYSKEKLFLKHAFKFSDTVLSCSQYCVDSGKRFLEIDYPTKVFYNNVDKSLYNPNLDGRMIRERFNIPKDSIVLMTMGRISKDMGVDFLLDNLQNITSISKKIIVFFVGAKAELCDRVVNSQQYNKQVRYSFDISFEEKPYFFACCDIFTAPTKEKHACMGIANIEAMMSRKAIISSTSGGHVETIENEVSGILVPFKNGKINSKIYIEQLSKIVHDEKLREYYANHGYKRGLKLFTNEQIVKEHDNFIKEKSNF